MSDRFGKLPFADLMVPAIDIAERGYLMPPVVQQKWAAAVPLVARGPAGLCRGLHAARARTATSASCLSSFSDAAFGALAAIDRPKTGGAAFYGGEIAEAAALPCACAAHGGSMTADDFAAYKPEWVEPIGMDYAGHDGETYRLHEIPPNGQGIAALIALGIVRRSSTSPR